MEKRKNFISTLKMCRFCLSRDDSLSSLYPNKPNNQKPTNAVPLSLKILACLSIEVFPSDKMLSFICNRCHFFMDLFYEYKQLCRRADERIFQYIQNGTTVEKLIWPTSLMKIFHYSLKNSSKTQVVETLMKDGTAIQVTSQGSNSDEEEEEEEEDDDNVYNIKIAGQSTDGSKCIEVTNKADSASTKKKPKQQGEYRNVESGCFPCDECDNSFPLQQLLDLHKAQKHRERTEECNQCDSKFFSKYDLMAHLARHSKETPFNCMACNKSFKRPDLLKRHTKMIHADIPRLACSSCESSFLSVEELQAHEKRHSRHNTERSYECAICERKFHEKASLNRHMYLIHDKKPTFSCEYCPELFTTAPKLARHVRSHAGDRPFPCKFCNKSFMKSHHYTRHLRLKHRECFRNPRTRRNETYRCEQCEEVFGTQDELIYHSAIHATQNLSCPLCQEKFKNVDAVTAHIKSHVNGMEFMCDLCELVFTSKNKLDIHLAIAHADELAQEMAQDESSMELDGEDFEDDNSINVKEEDGEMVVEIKKSSDFLAQTDSGDKTENTNSEAESETDVTYAELETVDTPAMTNKEVNIQEIQNVQKPTPQVMKASVPGAGAVSPVVAANSDSQTARILKKAEEVKRKLQQTTSPAVEKKEKSNNKVESSIGGASDKSLRLLEKELQELKRTNMRNDPIKAPARSVENLRNRRPQLFTSTPKARQVEEKKLIAASKALAIDKKSIERRLAKENRESKDNKDSKTAAREEKEIKEKEMKEKEIKEKEAKEKEIKEKELKEKEEKDLKEKAVKEKELKEKELKEKEVKEKELKEKELKDKDVKVKETSKNVVKNGASGKGQPEETARRSEKALCEETPQRVNKTQPEEAVRRSNRPSKIKDYAKMIQDKAQSNADDESDEDDDESKDKAEVTPRSRSRRASVKSAVKVAAAAAATPTPPRKRGRPRKDPPKEVPTKVRKEEEQEDSKVEESIVEDTETVTNESTSNNKEADIEPNREALKTPDDLDTVADADQTSNSDIKAPTGVLVSPSGQALKKVSLKALPPGIKRLPLAMATRPITSGELCEMQIGKKVVKVQKIVMTKAEVEAMAKKGLVEMKDGTMVLKPGIKLPSSEVLKSSLASDKDAGKESPTKSESGK